MKRKLFLILAFSLVLSVNVLASEEEFSESANVDYGYDESYDESEVQDEITSSKSDDIRESYNEDYDENEPQDITSSSYDDEEQSYNAEYDERITDDDEYMSTRSDKIKIMLNGKQLEFDVEPMLINSRTMVPMRVIFEALGAEVGWDGRTQTATGETEDTRIEITIGQDYLLKNGNIVVLDSPAVVISGRTLVPVRAIAESLDCKVEWYGETRVVEILK